MCATASRQVLRSGLTRPHGCCAGACLSAACSSAWQAGYEAAPNCVVAPLQQAERGRVPDRWWAASWALWMCVGAVAIGCALVYKMRIGCPVFVPLCICQPAAFGFALDVAVKLDPVIRLQNMQACTGNLTAEHASCATTSALWEFSTCYRLPYDNPFKRRLVQQPLHVHKRRRSFAACHQTEQSVWTHREGSHAACVDKTNGFRLQQQQRQSYCLNSYDAEKAPRWLAAHQGNADATSYESRMLFVAAMWLPKPILLMCCTAAEPALRRSYLSYSSG